MKNLNVIFGGANTLTISRAIFLLFIVILSVYFLFLNKSMNKNEHFTDAPLDSHKVELIIRNTYQAEFQRAPTEQEILFFQAYVVEKQPNEAQLVSAIKSSADIVNKAYNGDNLSTPSLVLQEAWGTEDDVEETFSHILNRLPDEGELATFSKLLKQDPNFNIDKLKQILYGSQEYQRLEQTQTNAVHSDLVGGVTDRQLSLIVIKNYRQIVSDDTANIDPDELHFLKKKLVSFNVDEKVFRQFLENYVKNQPFNQQLAASQLAQQFVKQEALAQQQALAQQKAQQQSQDQQMDKMKKELYTQLVDDLKKNNLTAQQTGYTDPSSGIEHTQIQAPNKQVMEALLKTCAASDRSGNYLDSSDVLDQIKKQAKCVFDKNLYAEDTEKSMAELISQRNKSQVRDTCIRNRKYLGLDEDMVLDPSLKWKLPEKTPGVCVGGKNDYQPTADQTALIGTLLPSANNTKVGSMVDFYPARYR